MVNRCRTCGKLPQEAILCAMARFDSALAAEETTDRARLGWFATVRWTTLLAGAGAVFAGQTALGVVVPFKPAAVALALIALSNIWLMWQLRQSPSSRQAAVAAPWLMCLDVAVLSWLLWRAGGVLNPASVFYLVEIVVAALVFGARWTWTIGALAVVGYAALFRSPPEDLQAAQMMHPEIALHMRGMWLAFALTAIVIAALVTRLAVVVERRDRAVAALRERNDRMTRAAGLATLAAGAAHELSTPLATIAVATREVERAIRSSPDAALADVRLIQSEIDRCRAILDAMAARTADPAGEPPQESTVRDVLAQVAARLSAGDRARVEVSNQVDGAVRWPMRTVVRALGNLVDNALQASPAQTPVRIAARVLPSDRVEIQIEDRGDGMTADQLSRAGEPFFTTKPPGQGTGLGLFVAHSVAEQLGGSVKLTSSKGAGTSATVDLPRDVLRSVPKDRS